MITDQEIDIAIIGGGPSGLFVYKNLVEKFSAGVSITIFESSQQLGSGMPYSSSGAGNEHVTNVSGNEIPVLVTSVAEWIETVPAKTLEAFGFEKSSYHDYKVLPRLLFGAYLNAQFELLKQQADKKKIKTTICFSSKVTDVIHTGKFSRLKLAVNNVAANEFDYVIMSTGHIWPLTFEKKIPGYFDSPYPPAKLAVQANYPVAVKGSSLTAIDAIRTLARSNGQFIQEAPHRMSFKAAEHSPDFKIVMHSLDGLLPAIRFHLDDPHLSKTNLLTQEEIDCHITDNNGFLSLDFIFEKDFKESIRQKDPAFYQLIKNMSIEKFVDAMMSCREDADAFSLFRAEYEEARKSIQQRRSVYWKEALAILSFAMNYPAKYLAAEDMLRLQKVLMPLISIVIAFVPQSSCEELIALYEAGRLQLVPVDNKSSVEPVAAGGIIYHYHSREGAEAVHYKMFIDCTGQKHLYFDDFPFKSLVKSGSLQPAKVKFITAKNAMLLKENGEEHISVTDDQYYLDLPGVAITDNFEVVDSKGIQNSRLYLMAVPYIGGYNPDYSGLDFCEAASEKIVCNILKDAAIVFGGAEKDIAVSGVG